MKFRIALQWGGLLAMLLVLYISRGKIGQVWGLLGSVNWLILALMVPVQLLSYWSNAKYYQSFFRIFNFSLPMTRLWPVSMALNFVNHAFPSGGVVGASYFSNALREEVSIGKSTLAQLMRYIFTFGSFLVVLGVGFLLLFLTGQSQQSSVKLIQLFLLGIIIVSIVFLVIMSDRKRLEALAKRIVDSINHIAMRWLRRRKQVITDAQRARFFDEFYQGYQTLIEERGHWKGPFLYALLGNVAEIATIYVVFLSFGNVINPGGVIAAYTLANVLSLISPVAGGAGVYEATMIGTLVGLGVPFNIAFTGTIVYRVLNATLFLPVGYYYYRKTI